MEGTSKFDTLYKSVVLQPKKDAIISEATFAKKTNPNKAKHPNRPKRRKNESDKKIKRMKKDKPIEHQRRDMKLSRGENRDRQSFVPIYRQLASHNDLPTARRILNIAKKAESGIWKISKRQVLEIGSKYKFNIPTVTKRVKHLGSTGIVMWRKNKDAYYLVKFSKHHLETRLR